MFKNLFEGGLNFTYNQEDLIKYFKEYQNLMKFWNFRFENSILNVEYENLVQNNKSETLDKMNKSLIAKEIVNRVINKLN